LSFISIDFLFIGPIFFLIHYMAGYRKPVLSLTVFGLFFYAHWSIYYVPLLVFSALVDFVAARKIDSTLVMKRRKFWLFLSIFLNLGLLGFFKYWNFFSQSVESTTGITLGIHELILPLGISFYTFQTLSYTFDVYRGKTKPEPNFLVYFLYVSFFPQLVAGPIERSKKLIPQLHAMTLPSREDFHIGLALVLWGVFLKACVSNNLFPFLENYFSNASGGVAAWLVGYFAVFSIYCDFYSYSIIAKGLARALGIQLSDNFRQPLLARNLSTFWKSWHITLTAWILDYVYIPLARRFPNEPWRSLIAIGTLVLVGFWHGASLNYLIFFLFHGVSMRLWRGTTKLLSTVKIHYAISRVFGHFSLFVILSLVGPMFIVTDSSLLAQNLQNRFTLDSGFPELVGTIGIYQFALGVMLAAVVMAFDTFHKDHPELFECIGRSRPARSLFGATMISSVFIFGSFGSSEYLYFDF
jgi:alginate O-acetyltransferase complex protein AlgI